MTGWSLQEVVASRAGSTPAESGDLTDEELTMLALAADPDQAPDDDAVPLQEYMVGTDGLLPGWYMPAPRGRVRGGWQRTVLLLVIAAFLVIEGFGLCSTYG